MEFQIVEGYAHKDALAALFSEYTDALVCAAPNFAGYLAQQDFANELEHLREKYDRLYLAFAPGDEAAGCAALHRFDTARCEIKRMYVRPAYRRCGLGECLSRRIIDDARALGYGSMVLDTFPFLESAVRMYRRLGFRDIAQYNDCPIPDEMIFLEKTL